MQKIVLAIGVLSAVVAVTPVRAQVTQPPEAAVSVQYPDITGRWSAYYRGSTTCPSVPEVLKVLQGGPQNGYFWGLKTVGNACVPAGIPSIEGRLGWPEPTCFQKIGTVERPASEWVDCTPLQITRRDTTGRVTQFTLAGRTYTRVQ